MINVETGSGNQFADSYVSVAYADQYCSLRYPNWASLSNEKKEAALVSASSYIDARWGEYVVSKQLRDDQGMLWPVKQGALKSGTYPKLLQQACVEYAVIASTTSLVSGAAGSSTNIDPATGITSVLKKQKVGPLEQEWEVVSGSTASANSAAAAVQANGWTVWAVADGLMRAVVWSESSQTADGKVFPRIHTRSYR